MKETEEYACVGATRREEEEDEDEDEDEDAGRWRRRDV